MDFSSAMWNKPAVDDAEVVTKSCRWNYDDDAFLARTFSSAGNQRLWTWSGWVKRGNMGSIDYYGLGIFGCDGTSSEAGDHLVNLSFHADDTLMFDVDKDDTDYTVATSAVFRDPAAWYHIVLVYDSDQATNTDRVKIYVNNVQYALTESSAGWIPRYYDGRINAVDVVHHIGAYHTTSFTTNFYDGYMADIYFIDGAAKAPGDFAAADSNGQWSPIAYDMSSHSGNSFHLPFTDNAGEQVFADSSSTGHTVTANGDVRHTRAQKKVDGSSIYFDGTDDHLSIGTHSDFAMGTGDFTIEGWVYPTSAQGQTDTGLFGFHPPSSGLAGPFVAIKSGNWQAYDGTDYRDGTVAVTTGTWSHLALVRDGSNLTLYLNGASIYSDSSFSSDFNGSTYAPHIGEIDGSGSYGFIGYLDEIRIVKGTAITPPSGGPTSALTAVSGTSLLIHSDWADGGLGGDSSGNFNDFQASNLVPSDQVNDRPTNNYCTLMGSVAALQESGDTGDLGISEGNLVSESTTVGYYVNYESSVSVTGGKWYFEYYGVQGSGSDPEDWPLFYLNDRFPDAVGSSATGLIDIVCGTQDGTPGVYMVAMDLDAGYIWRGFDGSWSNSATLSQIEASNGTNAVKTLTLAEKARLTGGLHVGVTHRNAGTTDSARLNFGADPTFAGQELIPATSEFYYAAPDGYNALSTANLPTPPIADGTDYFEAVKYTGDDDSGMGGGTQTLSLGFTPDLVWIKNRDTVSSHVIVDSERDAHYILSSDSADMENQSAGDQLEIATNGFTVTGDGGMSYATNTDGEDYIAWNWKADSAAGMDVVAYSGDSSEYGADSISDAIAHTAGAIDFAIFKNLSNTQDWAAWHKDLSSDDHSLYLSQINAEQDTGPHMLPVSTWTDTTFKVGNHASVSSWLFNEAGYEYVAYLFSEVAGYSKFGVYEGNGDPDGPFVWCGFKPAMVILKSIDGDRYWPIFDNKREGYNADNDALEVDSDAAEGTSDNLDLLSNGFKLRIATDPNAAETYIFAAFAEKPFKYASAR